MTRNNPAVIGRGDNLICNVCGMAEHRVESCCVDVVYHHGKCIRSLHRGFFRDSWITGLLPHVDACIVE